MMYMNLQFTHFCTKFWKFLSFKHLRESSRTASEIDEEVNTLSSLDLFETFNFKGSFKHFLEFLFRPFTCHKRNKTHVADKHLQ